MAGINVAGTQTNVTTLSGVKGISEQYGQNNRGAAAFDPTKIVPAAAPDPVTGANRANIIGTVPPGKAGIRQISPVIQNSTDPLVSGQKPTNQADNFVNSVAGVGLVPTVDASQAASAGKSLAPEHE